MCTMDKICAEASLAALKALAEGKSPQQAEAAALEAAETHEFVPEGMKLLIQAHVARVYRELPRQATQH